MKIKIIPVKAGVEFGTLKKGDCFQYADDYYIKIEGIDNGYEEFNAIILPDGSAVSFDSTTKVKKANAVLAIEVEID